MAASIAGSSKVIGPALEHVAGSLRRRTDRGAASAAGDGDASALWLATGLADDSLAATGGKVFGESQAALDTSAACNIVLAHKRSPRCIDEMVHPRLREVAFPRITAALVMPSTPDSDPPLRAARHLQHVRYEIRGPLARRAQELEREGYEIVKLNIGNPAAFGFRTPETMRIATIENLPQAEGYCHQKGIFPAREAVVMDTQTHGIPGVTAEDVFMGNGVSELILMTLEALLEPGDEVLLPAPDYPLWTAAVVVTGGKAVYYPCRPEAAFIPDPDEVARLVTPRTRALVVINPNNPTGAVYPREVVEQLAKVAERHKLVLMSDEIYNRILYDGAVHEPAALYCHSTLCATFSGLSKVYRACGFRTGWVFFSGRKEHAGEYLNCLELLASLRLCSNVPGQWAVQTALGGVQSIYDLTAPTGRLGRQRKALLDAVAKSKYLKLAKPMGAFYAFVGARTDRLPSFDDAEFAMALLERQHVLVVPGSSFNFDDKTHFRMTFLPDEETLATVFGRIDALLSEWRP
jgi:alanine-synthesizing transaminase